MQLNPQKYQFLVGLFILEDKTQSHQSTAGNNQVQEECLEVQLNHPLISHNTIIIELESEIKQEVEKVVQFSEVQKCLIKDKLVKSQNNFENYKIAIQRSRKLNTEFNQFRSPKLGEELDNFEQNTSWRREYYNLIEEAKKLLHYIDINSISLKFISKKLLRVMKDEKETVHKLEKYLHSLQHKINEKELEIQKMLNQMMIRVKDLFPISLMMGIQIILSALLAYLTYIHGIIFQNDQFLGKSQKTVFQIIKTLPVYRCTFIMILGVLGTGVCIRFFRRYQVNYVFIFGVSPRNKMNEYQFYKMFMLLLNIWTTCLVLELIFYDTNFSYYLVYSLFLLLINPMDLHYRPFRYELIYSLAHNLISPFGYVRFKEFFFGDILTSMVKPIIDFYFLTCFILDSPIFEDQALGECILNSGMIFALSVVPYHIRFWQCINRYFVTQLWFPHLVNAGKYMSTIIVLLIAYLQTFHFGLKEFYVPIYIFSTIYSFSWDILMDWSLCKGTQPGTRLLRDRLMYPKYFYYFSIFTNFILRFAWIMPLLPESYQQLFYKDQGGLVLCLSLAEAYRRIQWSLFRVENENITNPEKYRFLLEVPKVYL
ncbi:xenotropic and polytropic retrovirus receptor 1 [Stylonychia lemnae]|uniref:Xenotropic and polytropic retrovirus receptor 1 n=1 Tax=Stylonychia lemnae TaxID=5949 RepID=A0A078A835_STYLE|nr:xenotropic and polytropic retrovirus receptor 1 [Stylonychia lemnae]|eukprot:CDW78031.1 xenotropic and polytropic retrovirus receptor 1 [Stylonychia lemnae]